MGNRKDFERCMRILNDRFERVLKDRDYAMARLDLGEVIGASFMAYCMGVITEQEYNRLFQEKTNAYLDVDFTDRR